MKIDQDDIPPVCVCLLRRSYTSICLFCFTKCSSFSKYRKTVCLTCESKYIKNYKKMQSKLEKKKLLRVLIKIENEKKVHLYKDLRKHCASFL